MTILGQKGTFKGNFVQKVYRYVKKLDNSFNKTVKITIASARKLEKIEELIDTVGAIFWI